MVEERLTNNVLKNCFKAMKQYNPDPKNRVNPFFT